jgi:hypothetical protein
MISNAPIEDNIDYVGMNIEPIDTLTTSNGV